MNFQRINTKELNNFFLDSKDINFGILIISIYIVFDFGSLPGLFPYLNYNLKLPLILSVTALFYAIFLLFKRRVNFSQKTTLIFSLLWLFIIINAAISIDNQLLKQSIFKTFSIYFSIYIIIIGSVKNLFQYVFIIDVWLASILFSSYNGIMQGGLVWGNQWLRDENELALLVAIATPFAFLLFRIHKNKFKKICYLFCLISYVTASIVANSRGGTLSLFIVTFLCLYLDEKKVRNFIIILIASVMVISFAPQNYFDELETLEQGTEEGTAKDRIYLWGFAVKMFYDNVLFGVGPGNFALKFSSYEKGKRYPINAIRVAHSTPFTWLAEMGLTGIVLLLILLKNMYKNWKSTMNYIKKINDYEINYNLHIFNSLNHACAISQICFWFGSIFLTLNFYPFYWLLVPFSEAIKRIFLTKYFYIEDHLK